MSFSYIYGKREMVSYPRGRELPVHSRPLDSRKSR